MTESFTSGLISVQILGVDCCALGLNVGPQLYTISLSRYSQVVNHAIRMSISSFTYRWFPIKLRQGIRENIVASSLVVVAASVKLNSEFVLAPCCRLEVDVLNLFDVIQSSWRLFPLHIVDLLPVRCCNSDSPHVRSATYSCVLVTHVVEVLQGIHQSALLDHPRGRLR